MGVRVLSQILGQRKDTHGTIGDVWVQNVGCLVALCRGTPLFRTDCSVCGCWKSVTGTAEVRDEQNSLHDGCNSLMVGSRCQIAG